MVAVNNSLIESALSNVNQKQTNFNTNIKHEFNKFKRNIVEHLDFQTANTVRVWVINEDDFVLIRCKNKHSTPTITANFDGQMVSIECVRLMDP